MFETGTKLGRVSLVPRGEYDAAAVYNRLDIVEYEGSSYLVLTDGVTGVTPENSTSYMLIAQSGLDPLWLVFSGSNKKPAAGQQINAEFNQFNRNPKEKESVVGIMSGISGMGAQFICYATGVVTVVNDILGSATVKIGSVYNFYGATFTPAVSDTGVLSWTNDGGLPNPEPVDIKGHPGEDGKSAYQYAADGGYTGTEAEFQALMADVATKHYVDNAITGAMEASY